MAQAWKVRLIAAALFTATAGVTAQTTWEPVNPGGMVTPGMTPPLVDVPSASSVAPTLPAPEVVALFREGCVAHEAEISRVVDWALTQGHEPVDTALGGGFDHLLAGRGGTVLAAPRSQGRVLMVVTDGGQCSVWVEQTEGPPLRLAFAAMVGELLAGAGSAVPKPQVDRSIERSGAWRQQTQWRYRRVGGDQDFALTSVTTLSQTLGAQVLHMQPQPRSTGSTPDGLPAR